VQQLRQLSYSRKQSKDSNSMATLGVQLGSQAIGLVSSTVGALLAAHTARLKAAQSENAAIVNLIPEYDADIQGIVAAYNSGQASAAQCIQALQVVDANVVKYLRSQVGKAGTAWSDSVGMTGQCNSSCTAGCCIYYGDLGPPISLIQIAMGGAGGKWGPNDPRIAFSAGGTTVQVPAVFASKYGGTNRAAYTLNVIKRAAGSANPPQYAQVGSPTTSPVGRVLEGTPAGPTISFSQQSQGLLGNAAMSFVQPSTGSPLAPSAASRYSPLLIGGGVVVAGLIAYLLAKQ
jgi:hypothetical protein